MAPYICLAQVMVAGPTNDDRRFPGRQVSQLASLGKMEEWAISNIESHHGKGLEALFDVVWKAGDCAWLPYYEISHLEALTQYFFG